MIRQRIIAGALSSGAIRAISIAINFFVTPFLLRRLGDTQYGIFILVGSVVSQGALFDVGIEPAIVKYVAEYNVTRDHDGLRKLIATALSLYCILGALVLLLAAAVAPFFPYLFNIPEAYRSPAQFALLLSGIQIAISIPFATPGAILWGLQRYELCNAVAVVAIIMSTTTTIVVLLMGGGLIGMLAANIPVTILARLIMVWCVRRVAPEFSLTLRGTRRGLIRKLLSFSTSTFILQVADSWRTRIDEMIIGVFLPVSAVGFYAVARRISALPSMFSDPVLSAFLPLASSLHAQDDADRLRSLYLVGTRVVFAICMPMLLTVVVLAGPLLSIWVGARYAVNAPIAVVLAVAGVLEIGYWPGRLIVQGIDQHHDISKAALCAAIANVVLSLLLVRPLGLMGVALGTLLPAIIVNLGYIWPRTMRAVGVTGRDLLKQAIAPTVVPALPMAAAMYVLNRALDPTGLMLVAFFAAFSVACYAAIFMAFFAGTSERQLLQHLINRSIRREPSPL